MEGTHQFTYKGTLVCYGFIITRLWTSLQRKVFGFKLEGPMSVRPHTKQNWFLFLNFPYEIIKKVYLLTLLKDIQIYRSHEVCWFMAFSFITFYTILLVTFSIILYVFLLLCIFIDMYFYYYVIGSFVNWSILIVMYVPFCVIWFCCSVYCLCVKVYCTAATGCQPVYCLCVNVYCTAVLFVCECVLYCCTVCV
jgi:hypothetical protein